MKCRVCGYEVEAGASHCPMCGTRVISGADRSADEISWNTKDFPKPKEMADIEMSWPDLNSFNRQTPVSEEKIEEALDKKEPLTVMSEDASEGYVSIPTPAEQRPPVKPYIPPMSKATMEVRTSNVPPEDRPKDEPELPSYWYTQKFTATGIMQTGPAWPMAPGSTKPNFPTTATIETMTLSDPVPMMPERPEEAEGPGFTLDDKLTEFSEPVQEPSEPSATHTFINTKAAETIKTAAFDTLQQKNDEFQKLLDREYDKLKFLHGDDEAEDFSRSGRFVPEEKVQAKDLMTFEKMLMQEPEVPAEKTPAQKFFTEPTEDEKNAADPVFADFIAPAGDPSKYDINRIEDTIRQLEEQKARAESLRTESEKRLDVMSAARDAYYANLDKAAAETPAETAPEDESVDDASPVDLGDEPTKKIPVGSILKALAAGGAVAAVEKSMETVHAAEEAAEAVADTAAAAAETAAEIAETVSEQPVKTAAMAATTLASISEDAGWTRVFRRSLTEEAEGRAKIYEEKSAEADTDHPIDAAEEIAKKYESLFGRPAKQEEEEPERKSWTIEDPSVFAAIRQPEEPQSEEDIEASEASEAKAAEILTASKAAEKPAEPAETAEEAAETAEPAEEPAAQEAETIETAAEGAVAEAESIDAKLAEAEKAMEEKLAEADAALNQKAEDEVPSEGEAAEAQPFEEAQTEEAQPAEDAQPEEAQTEEPKPEAEETEAQPAAGEEDVLEEALSEDSEPSEPTHEFDLEDVDEESEEPSSEEDEDDETEVKSKHVFLKIIAIILVICAIFEGIVMGLKHFAPDAQITENAVQIEQGVGDALVSLYNSITDGIHKLFGY